MPNTVYLCFISSVKKAMSFSVITSKGHRRGIPGGYGIIRLAEGNPSDLLSGTVIFLPYPIFFSTQIGRASCRERV